MNFYWLDKNQNRLESKPIQFITSIIIFKEKRNNKNKKTIKKQAKKI